MRKKVELGLVKRVTTNIFAYPTESFYALGVDATDPKAIRHLFRVKRREPNKPIALIAGSLKQVQQYFFTSSTELKLARKYWPGSLTILLKPKKAIAAGALGARYVGVRVPAHAQARRLALKLRAPITATSANISGRPPTKSAKNVKRNFPDILVMPGRCGRQRLPSTIVYCNAQQINIIRSGSIRL